MEKRGLLMVTAAVLWTAGVGMGLFQLVTRTEVGILGGAVVAAATLLTVSLIIDSSIDRAVRRTVRANEVSNSKVLEEVARRLVRELKEQEQVNGQRSTLRPL